MERIGSLMVAPSAERKAEPGRFGQALRTAAADVASGVASSVALASPFLPGGPVLAGAVRGLAHAVGRAAGPGSAVAAGVETGGGDVLDATRALQQDAQLFNAHYLNLQESMQQESRAFTSLSNVMKVRHDSAKAAINNIH